VLKIVLKENKGEILTKLKDYINVFDRASAGILLEHYLIEHRIDLELSTSLP
jgi:hypothetical protein